MVLASISEAVRAPLVKLLEPACKALRYQGPAEGKLFKGIALKSITFGLLVGWIRIKV